jgi:hypothetical protein
MATFRSVLKQLCKERQITLSELALSIGRPANWLSVFGSKKGIPYHELNQIMKILKADGHDKLMLRHIAKFTTPRQGIVINDDFIDAIYGEIMINNTELDNCKQVCKAVLKFAGVKTKVK